MDEEPQKTGLSIAEAREIAEHAAGFFVEAECQNKIVTDKEDLRIELTLVLRVPDRNIVAFDLCHLEHDKDGLGPERNALVEKSHQCTLEIRQLLQEVFRRTEESFNKLLPSVVTNVLKKIPSINFERFLPPFVTKLLKKISSSTSRFLPHRSPALKKLLDALQTRFERMLEEHLTLEAQQYEGAIEKKPFFGSDADMIEETITDRFAKTKQDCEEYFRGIGEDVASLSSVANTSEKASGEE